MDLFDTAMQHGEAIATNGYLLRRVEELTSQLAERDREITRLREEAKSTKKRLQQHHVADAFWKSWALNGETHRHGYYESTWMAIHAAIDAARGEGE